MAKGLCCQIQAQGGLGRPIQLSIRKKDGTTVERCGVCEVGPSCSNPQKTVFRFRFLASRVCGIAGTSSCQPTPAGIAQYNTARTQASTLGSPVEYEDPFTVKPGDPYVALPIPGAGAPSRVTYRLP